jgi:hypothetical protein
MFDGILIAVILVIVVLIIYVLLLKIVATEFTKTFGTDLMFSYIISFFFFPFAVIGILGEKVITSITKPKQDVTVHKMVL